MSDIYKVTLDRENLDALMNFLSISGQIDTTVDENDNINFDIPKDSNINIHTIDVEKLLFDEIEKLEKRRDKMKTNGKRKADIEQTIDGLKKSVNILLKVLDKK